MYPELLQALCITDENFTEVNCLVTLIPTTWSIQIVPEKA